jgi:hypothetical protein
MRKSLFDRFAGFCAIITGIAGLLYSVAFIILQNNLLSALFLLVGGLFATAAITALYEHLREADSAFAFLGIFFALAGALGSTVHAGFDLSNALHPPSGLIADLPSSVDPRGLMTFGLAGIGLFVLSWLVVSGRKLSRNLGYLGYLSAILMLILYVGRLVVLQSTSLVIVIPALLEGFLINPIWYIWLGVILLRKK